MTFELQQYPLTSCMEQLSMESNEDVEPSKARKAELENFRVLFFPLTNVYNEKGDIVEGKLVVTVTHEKDRKTTIIAQAETEHREDSRESLSLLPEKLRRDIAEKINAILEKRSAGREDPRPSNPTDDDLRGFCLFT